MHRKQVPILLNTVLIVCYEDNGFGGVTMYNKCIPFVIIIEPVHAISNNVAF